jgi:lysozyme
MDISPAGLGALAGREGVRTLAYRDSRGIWTIGVGHTAAAGLPHPCAGMELTHQQVLDLFKLDLQQYVAAVNRAVKVTCTQNQFDAMTSLCFNIGINGFAGSSVARDLNRGDTKGAADAFLLWDHPEELLGRRKAERAQFLTSDAPRQVTLVGAVIHPVVGPSVPTI